MQTEHGEECKRPIEWSRLPYAQEGIRKELYRIAIPWICKHLHSTMTRWMQVFLAARYAKYVAPSNPKKSAKYYCWARAQVLFQA